MIYKGKNSKEWPKTCDSTPLLCPLDGCHAFFCKEHLSVVTSTSYSSARLDTLSKMAWKWVSMFDRASVRTCFNVLMCWSACSMSGQALSVGHVPLNNVQRDDKLKIEHCLG